MLSTIKINIVKIIITTVVDIKVPFYSILMKTSLTRGNFITYQKSLHHQSQGSILFQFYNMAKIITSSIILDFVKLSKSHQSSEVRHHNLIYHKKCYQIVKSHQSPEVEAQTVWPWQLAVLLPPFSTLLY